MRSHVPKKYHLSELDNQIDLFNTSPVVFNKLMESSDYGEIRSFVIADYAGNPVILDLRPKMKLKNMAQGPFNLYAALVVGEIVYIAQTDLFGKIAFTRFRPGCCFESFSQFNDLLVVGTDIECAAFSSDNLMSIDSDLLAQSGLKFIFGVAPVNKLREFQGIVFSFGNENE